MIGGLESYQYADPEIFGLENLEIQKVWKVWFGKLNPPKFVNL